MKNVSKPLAFANLTLFCLIGLCGLAHAGAAGRVQFVNGDVQISTPAGATHQAHKGDLINEGDSVTCGPAATAQIRMEDGGFIAVRAETTLKFDQFVFSGQQDGNERSVFSLIKGGFRAVTGLIGQVNKKNYKINTPVATIGIRGTDHETVLIVPGSAMALLAPAGAYSKVNLGETTLTTDRGTINIMPNQMGFAAGLNQPPQVQTVNTSVFTAAPAATPQLKAEKKQEKAEPTPAAATAPEAPVVVTTAQETPTTAPPTQETPVAAPVVATPEAPLVVAVVQQAPAAAPLPQEAQPVARSNTVTDGLAPAAGLVANSLPPPPVASAATEAVMAAPVVMSRQTLPAPVVDPAGNTVNLTAETSSTPAGQVTPVQSLIASHAQAAADDALLAKNAALAAVNAATTSNTNLAAMAAPNTTTLATDLAAVQSTIGSTNAALATASSTNLAGSVAQAGANASVAKTQAATAAALAAAAQSALRANAAFADVTAGPANAVVQSSNAGLQAGNTAVQSAAATVSKESTAFSTALGSATTALGSASARLSAVNSKLDTVASQNALLLSAQGASASELSAAQNAANAAVAAADAAQAAAASALTKQTAGDLLAAQAQLLIAQQQLAAAQAGQGTAQGAQAEVSAQLTKAITALTLASKALTEATDVATAAAADAGVAQAQLAAAQTATANAAAALAASNANLTKLDSSAAAITANAPIAAYNNPAVVGNFVAAAMFAVPTDGGFTEASAPHIVAQPNTSYVLDGTGNLVEARNMSFQLQSNQSGVALKPSITAGTGADIKWAGGTAADTFKLADNSIYMGRWVNPTVTVTDNTTTANGYSYTPAASLWAVLLPPPADYVPTLIGTSHYTKVGNTTPVDALGNLGTLNSASLTANFTSQLVDAAVNLTMGVGPMAGTYDLAGKAMSIDSKGGFGVSKAGALASSCSVGTCAAGATGYSADFGGSFAGNAAANAGMSYNIWPTVAANLPASDSIKGLLAFTAPAPLVNSAGPLQAYGATGTSVAYTGDASGNAGAYNFVAKPGDLTPLDAPTTFTENYGAGQGFRTDVLGATRALSDPVTSTNGIRYGVWDFVGNVNTTQQQVMQPNQKGSSSMLPIYIVGTEGYLDSPVVWYNSTAAGVGNTGPLNGIFSYVPVVKMSLDQNSWTAGGTSLASLTADFSRQTVSVALGGTLDTNHWSVSSNDKPISFFWNPGNSMGARFYDSAPVIKVSTSAINADTPNCAGCAGSINGAFVGQNYGGAVVQYSLWDNTKSAGMNVGGLVGFDRTQVGSNPPLGNSGTPATSPGTFVLANSWQIESPTTVATNAAGVLTGWGGKGWNVSVAPSVGSTAQFADSSSGIIGWGQWAAGSVATSDFSYVPAAQWHWITAPEPTPIYLAQVLTTESAVYTLAGGDVTRAGSDSSKAAHGTINEGTSLTANFSTQTVAVNLNATVNGHSWKASTADAPLQYLNNSSQSGFYADSFRLPSQPGYLTVTVDAASTIASGSLAGQLVGAALGGAILKFNLMGQLAPANVAQVNRATVSESVRGVVALAAAAPNDPATPYQMVLTSISDPKAVAPSVMIGGSYNNASRVLTTADGSLTQFDHSGGSGSVVQRVSGNYADQGSAVIAGATVSWGRWDAGTVVKVTDRVTGAQQNITLTGGAHTVLGPVMTEPVSLPMTGSFAYTRVGNTLPTDDQGVAGVLNSATLSANFTAQTVNVGVNVMVAGATLDATATGVPIQQRANFFADSKMTGPGALVVTCQSGACGTTNQGAIGGGFAGPGGTAAAFSYGFEKTGSNAGTVSGVAVFKR